tara:strand:- start:548 stop:925 length:378 start_codon:yes stop_codon:yes gene_type:complete
LEDNAEKSTFFVSDSIKHLINEETFVASDKQNLKFATSDLILEVKSKNAINYHDIAFYHAGEIVKFYSDASAFATLISDNSHSDNVLQCRMLLKNKNCLLRLECKFLEFSKLSNSSYIYSLRICD